MVVEMLRRVAARNAGSLVLAGGLVAGLAGCSSDDKPHRSGQQRPSVDDLDGRDRGLQSKDINQAADQMAADLLSDPELNRSRDQWTVVVTNIDDKTRDRQFMTDYDIFLQALKARLAKQGRGRVTLITNRDKFYNLRDKELEGGGRDEFGQGGGGGRGAPMAVNPDFALTGVVRDLPRRGTIYYQMEFSVEDLKRRTTAWSGSYEVKVARD
ncbi:MAG: hypothetical protein JWO31_3582 [Phycisphaerales bacterium]|nr:hypothetical protein [Phycisphaerales bacterium]